MSKKQQKSASRKIQEKLGSADASGEQPHDHSCGNKQNTDQLEVRESHSALATAEVGVAHMPWTKFINSTSTADWPTSVLNPVLLW